MKKWKSKGEINRGHPKRLRKTFPNSDPVCVMIYNIPRELRDRFKAYCVVRGVGMQEVLREFMVDCIEGRI